MQDLVEFIESEVTEGTVCSVTLEIGAFAAVDARAVRQSFEVCVEGTRLEGAELRIVQMPGKELSLTQLEISEEEPRCA